ncbi:Uncharacterised protein (plasmid) [Tsukamurella tyrosinosolvens]|uniref:DUF1508 domain-containing protein n=1 Tax=Tsukamurella tyrosinosolvens TaxID=57704 RepID=A0A1H4U8H6_TSUTY|nr:hypothetical protein [Tsukamurella tyrosinosolvens]KXO93010.1 hypothetical protein AXK58_14160 [Tsukamurella tyrosinosolvens]SEC64474.1 hypothetical protein SAMN04489793_2799 [Tsukamurella tyrosinosolvens]VEH94026.1 Uncharacterised protein [Tsukamurella tyrosinosolvens]
MHFNDFEKLHFAGSAFTAHRLSDSDPDETLLQVTLGEAKSGGSWRVIVWEEETGKVRSAVNVADRSSAYAKADEVASAYL